MRQWLPNANGADLRQPHALPFASNASVQGRPANRAFAPSSGASGPVRRRLQGPGGAFCQRLAGPKSVRMRLPRFTIRLPVRFRLLPWPLLKPSFRHGRSQAFLPLFQSRDTGQQRFAFIALSVRPPDPIRIAPNGCARLVFQRCECYAFTSIGLKFPFHFQGFIPVSGGCFFPLDD